MIKQLGNDSPLLDQQLAAGLRGDFEEGLRIAKELEKKFPDNHRAAFNRAWYLMMQGELLKGLECLSRGRWCQAFGDPPLPTQKPIYRSENLEGKNLLLCSEGGLGDEIINIRFAKDFASRGAKVTVTCDPSLAPVFARIDGISSVVSRAAAPEVYHDYWVPAMSAGHILQKEFSDLDGRPYLTANPDFVEKWQKILKKKFRFDESESGGKKHFWSKDSKSIAPKIGLKFYGNPKFEHEQHRKFSAQDLITAVGDRPWVNLQKEETDLPLDSWEDTLALLSQLDLVITSCTSIAHASAALGKETWVIVPILPYYIWAPPGDRSPWYDSVRLYRQEKYGDWSSAFEKIKRDLETRFK
jgi:hypothetical protein